MKGKKILFVLHAILTGALGYAQTAHKDFQDGKVIFQIREEADVLLPSEEGRVSFREVPFLAELAQEYGITSVTQKHPSCEDPALRKTYEIEFDKYSRVEELVETLSRFGFLKYAQKKMLLKLFFTPNDYYYGPSSLWHLFKIRAADAWDITKGSASIVAAVIDNAIMTTHPDFAGKISPKSYDIADKDKNPDPPSSTNEWDHGTHTAGLVGAATNNSVGVSAIGFNTTIMAIKAAKNINPLSPDFGFDGIIYAADSGAKVISISWGGVANASQISYEQSVINYAHNKGCVIVAAAGNDGLETKTYPAACNHVISVAATGQTDAKSSFSNYGTWVTLSAPGETIGSTITNHPGPWTGIVYYDYKSGTSMATPIVAGLCALIWSVNPNMTASQVKNCLVSTCDNIDASNAGYVGKIGVGRINALKAVQCATTITTDINSIEEDGFAVNAYPNPAQSSLTIQVNSKNNDVIVAKLFGVHGQLVAQKELLPATVDPYSQIIDLTACAHGIYCLQVTSGDRQINRKIVVLH